MDSTEEASVVKVGDLIRWSQTFTPEYNQLVGSNERTKQSPFCFNQDINQKIAYWNGDITLLNAQAIVCCNNESLNDTDPVTSLTIHRAGKELREELMNDIRTCRTGEAKITKGFQLAARHVIHTVGPRYNIKYKTAAENALFNSYRNTLLLLREMNLRTVGLRCIHTHRRSYPTVEGTHIALRTVRRFLEKFLESVDLVVFVVTGSDRESYNSLLPLYFPRSLQEESYAAYRLPMDVGNDDGEPVIAERKIRISANPAKDTLQGEDDYDDNNGVDEDDVDSSMNDILGTDLSVGEHSFSKMEANLDKERMIKSRSSTDNANQTIDQQKLTYERYLKRSKNENFAEMSSLRFLYQSGFDKNNFPVVLFIARNFPAQKISPDKALLYFIHQMDQVVNDKFIFVYIHSLADSDKHPSGECFKRLFQILDSRYKANLESLYMLHAGLWSKLSFWWFSTFNSPDIKSKVHYLPGVEYLFSRIPHDQIDLPPFILEYDYEINGIRYYTAPDDDL